MVKVSKSGPSSHDSTTVSDENRRPCGFGSGMPREMRKFLRARRLGGTLAPPSYPRTVPLGVNRVPSCRTTAWRDRRAARPDLEIPTVVRTYCDTHYIVDIGDYGSAISIRRNLCSLGLNNLPMISSVSGTLSISYIIRGVLFTTRERQESEWD